MQRIWAPWREKYITKIIDREKSCVFCRIVARKKDKQDLIFIRKEHAYAVLNLYPYSNGHCLIVSNRHVGDIAKLPPAEYIQLMELLKETKEIVQAALKPHGFNVGINLGRIAGAGLPSHLHIHLVPRWKGDHNFMAVTSDTKVLSQSLSVIYKKLDDAYTQRYRRVRK